MATALVVGGGLGGCLLAIYLARRGMSVEVYERHADPRRGTTKRSALNITLCERGLLALAEVGLRERVEAMAVPARGRRVHGADGSTAYQPYGNHGEAIYSISRSDLNAALMDQAESEPRVRFHFGKKCVHVDSALPSARFEDSTGAVVEARADRIFGADGAYSAVRSHLQKTERFNYSQQYWNQGYRSLTIPAGLNGSAQLEPEVLHIWPRGTRMLIGFPNRDGTTSCSLLLPYKGDFSFDSLASEASIRQFFKEAFPDVVELIPELTQQFLGGAPNSLLTIRCNPWSFQDKVLLVGDAAHAILPSHGQGANAAFEDCRILASCMDEHGADWVAVFQSFEAVRRPSMDVMADLCIEHFVEICELVGDPKFLKRREVERCLSELYPALYQPLYSMITFGSMPYIEATLIDQRQRHALDRILSTPEMMTSLGSPEVRQFLEGSLGEPGGVV